MPNTTPAKQQNKAKIIANRITAEIQKAIQTMKSVQSSLHFSADDDKKPWELKTNWAKSSFCH